MIGKHCKNIRISNKCIFKREKGVKLFINQVF